MRPTPDTVEPPFPAQVAHLTAILTPRVAKAYGPGQKKLRAPLESPHHFNSMAALRERQAGLASFDLPPDMRKVQGHWGATYTQALYTRPGDARAARTLLRQIEALEAVLDAVAGRLIKQLEAN